MFNVIVPSRFQRTENMVLARWMEKTPDQLKKEEDTFRLSLEEKPSWWRPWKRPPTEQDIRDLRAACIEQHRGDLLAVVFRKFPAPPEDELRELFRLASGPAMIGFQTTPETGARQILFLDFQAMNELLDAGARSPSLLEHARSVLTEAKGALQEPFKGRSNREELLLAIEAMDVMKAGTPTETFAQTGASLGQTPEGH